MPPREYGQACSLAGALDRVGERWSMLIVRELSLGPLRYRELARAVGGAPTDVLTRRLGDLERHGVVRRRKLEQPASATVYELTALGRGLERPMIELSRWGMNFLDANDVADFAPSSLPNALRVILQPPPDVSLTVTLHSEGQAFNLRIDNGWIEAARGDAADADLRLSGSPRDVIAAFVLGEEGVTIVDRTGEGGEASVDGAAADTGADGVVGVEIDGDRNALQALRSMVVIPERLHADALAEVSG
jgi:DNA-binding HxlR family transcriptional regulator